MKVEVGESLVLSWLRHIKGCQIVQSNWKASKVWPLSEKDKLQGLMENAQSFFLDKHNYNVFKKNRNVVQVLQQAEIDLVGIDYNENGSRLYAVDVAFHEGGLLYGAGRKETTEAILRKCLRTAMCLYGYLRQTSGEVIFASPKINPSNMTDISACIDDVEVVLKDIGLDFNVQVIANERFRTEMLEPLIDRIGDIADTSELFMRSLQMCKLFSSKSSKGLISVLDDKVIL